MKTILQGRLNGIQSNKMKSLMDMKYRPREIAEEIGISQNQVYRVYVALGCPHERDEYNNIWIHGTSFKLWYIETYRKTELEENEAFCITCKQAVSILNPEKKQKGNTHYVICLCPHCGRRISRITGIAHD